MKKSNAILTATMLIGLHTLLFIALLGEKKAASALGRRHGKENPVAEKAIFPAEAKPPSWSVEAMPEPERKSMAMPSHMPGHLRHDRPAHRATRNYDRLIGDPYHGAIVVDAHSGRILFEDRASAYGYPASVTKLMTMLLVIEAIQTAEISKTDLVHINNEVAGIGGSQVWLDPKETDFTVEDMLYALVVHSANDAARALAIHLSGSRAAFVARMNRKARELGMNATRYHSDHGLPPEDGSQPDISTAYDLALLSLACLRHPETTAYTGTELTYLRAGKTMLATRNALARRIDGYPGCDGLKTGFHNRGGWSLAATAERNGRRIVSIVLGSPKKVTRNRISRELLDRGFAELENPPKTTPTKVPPAAQLSFTTRCDQVAEDQHRDQIRHSRTLDRRAARRRCAGALAAPPPSRKPP